MSNNAGDKAAAKSDPDRAHPWKMPERIQSAWVGSPWADITPWIRSCRVETKHSSGLGHPMRERTRST
eukprot:4381371-Pyramimonas_sp.AAC.1